VSHIGYGKYTNDPDVRAAAYRIAADENLHMIFSAT